MAFKCKFCHSKDCDFDDDELGREKKVCTECVIKYKKSSKYKRLLTILEETHGLIEKDLEKMSYVGGSSGYHLSYFEAKFQHIAKPDYEDYCLCGSQIQINCYLKDLNEDGPVIVIGNCCKEKFLSQVVKTCIECDITHASKTTLSCRTCVATSKREEKAREQKRINAMPKHCACGKEIKKCFAKCYTCFISKA